MRRFVIFLLLCVLPLQVVLAGAADQLAHADNRHSVQTHTVVSEVKFVTVDADISEDEASRCHWECSHCSCFHSVALPALRIGSLAIPSTANVTSPYRAVHQNRILVQRPERPKWLQFA